MNFLKTITFGLLASVCATASSVLEAQNLTGIYLGIKGGGSWWRIKFKEDAENTAPLSEDTSFTSKGLGHIGAFVGGGKEFGNRFYLGGQIAAGGLLGTFKQGDENSNAEFKPRYYYGADVHIGYALKSGCLVYLSGGFEGQGTRFEMKGTAFGQSIDFKEGDRTQIPYGTVGLGLRYQFSNGVFVGGEFKAMFGAKTTWKIGKNDKIGEALKVADTAATVLDSIAFYDVNGDIDYDIVGGFIDGAKKIGITFDYTTDGNQLLDMAGQPIAEDRAKQILDASLSEGKAFLNKAKAGLTQLNSGEIKQKTRLQNYAVSVSIGYKF